MQMKTNMQEGDLGVLWGLPHLEGKGRKWVWVKGIVRL